MDPNTTLKQIHDFISSQSTGVIVDVWCEHLYQWILKGGFEPNWSQYQLGTSYYKCRKVHMDKPDYDPVAYPD